MIRKKNPLLDSIPNWITSEDYTHPKPDPECYQIAIKKFKKSGGQVVGL